MQRTSFLLIIGIFLVVLVGGYTGYQVWQKSANEQELQKIEKSLEEAKREALKNENQQIGKALSAKQTVSKIKESNVKWSEVIKKVRATIPKKSGVPVVNVLSYSGSANSGISMNVKTLPTSDGLYDDVSDLIKSFDDSDSFVDSFVPSISVGEDDEGRKILTFSFSTKYLVKENLEEALGEILEVKR
mgnify:CR=1 FL=1